MTNSFAAGFSWIALHWWVVLVAYATGIAATCRWGLETEKAKVQRAERNRKKELRTLANKISTYGRNVHQRYPTDSSLGRTQSPKGSPQRLLEAKRLISSCGSPLVAPDC